MSKQAKIFFQPQSSTSRNCGVHVLNNLLGSAKYNKQLLNKICFNLSSEFINPYKSILGGDFDVTVLMDALKDHNLSVAWLKKNEEISNFWSDPNFVGFLLNNEQEKANFFSKLLGSGRHWTCVKKVNGRYVHLDSLEKGPKIFEEQAQVEGMLQIFKEKGGTILIVSSQQNFRQT